MKMTQEVKDQLLGLVPMEANATHKFTPSMFDNVDENFRPIFEIKQFNNEDFLTIKEMLHDDIMTSTSKKKKTVKSIEEKNAKYMKLLHKYVIGWENMYYPSEGEVKEHVYDGTLEDFMSNTDECLQSILAEAMKISGLRFD